MKRIMLRVAYDGTNYCGWQVQPNQPTIEGELNKALTSLLKEEIKVIGASRTDSGVHSLGNVAVFDTNSPIPPHKICFALNQRLPEDIRVQSSMEVASDFHPRHCDTRKTYCYSIQNSMVAMPTTRLYSYFVHNSLDVEKMQEAANYLVGTHDFKSFCSIYTTVEDTVRTIYQVEVKKEQDQIKILIKGNGFLYNMVRIIAGTLLQVGYGRMEPEKMKEILAGKDRVLAGPTAPAHGLMLMEIEYLD